MEPDWSIDTAFLFRIILSVLSGLLIGMEREYKGKDAGLKTNTLVSAGACAFVILSLEFTGKDFIDVTRVLGQVVTGIGFLGAGVILKRKNTVKGLTTAASVWCSAAAGCIAAFYMVTNLIFFTVAVVLVNIAFGLLDNKI
ncbi:MAG: magnesium transporter MgtC [Pseudozobellia sp.]|nr:magnesium transporter MgtC [Pseudozobellia sp.]MBG48093.1 magnesium transporter MgtC [Pseudozobellia sp.]